MKTVYLYAAAAGLLLSASCGDRAGNNNRGPIRLGDSATIVTEHDSQYLKDEVMDMEPNRAARPDTASGASVPPPPPPAKDTVAAVQPRPEPEAKGEGIEFNGTRLVFSGLKLKDARRQDAAREDGLSYTLEGGDPATARLLVSGAKNVTVKQRYQSRLVLKSSLGTVDLRDLGLYTSGWNTVKGAQSFSLNSLDKLAYSQVNNNKIKTAADRELRKRRTSSRVIQNWMKEIRKVRDAGDQPCDIILDNVQWQVSGTDAKGKTFHKTIRLDA